MEICENVKREKKREERREERQKRKMGEIYGAGGELSHKKKAAHPPGGDGLLSGNVRGFMEGSNFS